MVISVLAAFSLARMGFRGSKTLSTGVFLTYLVPPSLLFMPLFQIIGVDRPDQHRLVPGTAVSDAGGAVLHLDHDRLFQFRPKGTG